MIIMMIAQAPGGRGPGHRGGRSRVTGGRRRRARVLQLNVTSTTEVLGNDCPGPAAARVTVAAAAVKLPVAAGAGPEFSNLT